MIIVLQRCAVVCVGQFNSFRLGVIIIRFDGLVRARRFSGREPMMFIAAATRIASVSGAVLFSRRKEPRVGSSYIPRDKHGTYHR